MANRRERGAKSKARYFFFMFFSALSNAQSLPTERVFSHSSLCFSLSTISFPGLRGVCCGLSRRFYLCCALLLSTCNGKVLRMGITEVTVEVSNPRDQTHWQKLDLIADTGAIFSVIPRSTLDQLGITPYAEETFHLADGSEIRRPMGDVFIRIDGKARTVPTIFGEPTDTPLLGVTALEILGYAIDPRTRKLEPTKMLLL